MDHKTAAIVLCAGIGSRMDGLPDDINKCAIPIAGTTPVSYTVSALLQSGVNKIVVVTGYASDSVVSALASCAETDKTAFVKNEFYDYHGCNYSLACGVVSQHCSDAERLIIAEGDSLLHRLSINKLIELGNGTSSLLRDSSYINYKRSVIAIGSGAGISRYEYDTAHSGLLPSLSDNEVIIGESMQLWSFSGDALKRLRKILMEYKCAADQSETAVKHSGVHSINQLDARIRPVFSDCPDDWINLNTKQDLLKAERAQWLIK